MSARRYSAAEAYWATDLALHRIIFTSCIVLPPTTPLDTGILGLETHQINHLGTYLRIVLAEPPYSVGAIGA